MADDAQRLIIDLEARLNNFEKAFKKAGGIANDNWRAVEARGQAAAKRIDAAFSGFSKNRELKLNLPLADVSKFQSELDRLSLPDRLRNSLGGIAAAFSINEIRKMADEFTDAKNKIGAAIDDASKAATTTSAVADIAERSRSSFTATADLYARLSRASKGFGATQAEVAVAVETVSKALQITGASAQEATSSALQLGQALGSGKLQGDELRSLSENAPLLMGAIAKEFGVAQSALKDLGAQGSLTSDRVFKALLTAAPEIGRTFAGTTATTAQAFEALTTAATRFVGENGAVQAGMRATSQVLQGLSTHFGAAANAAGVLGLVIASRLVSSGLTPLVTAFAANARATASAAVAQIEFSSIVGTSALRMGAATLAARGFSAALSLIGGPVGAVLLGVAAATTYFAAEAQKAEEASKRYTADLADLEAKAEAATPAVAGLGNAVAETATKMNALEINRLGQQLHQAEADAEAAALKLQELTTFVQEYGQSAPENDRLKSFFEKIEKAMTGDTAAALAAEQAIADFANSDPNLQGIADAFLPVLERLAAVRASIAATKASIASLSGQAVPGKPADTSGATLDVAGEKRDFGAAILKQRVDKAGKDDGLRAREKQGEILKDAGDLVSPGDAYKTAVAEIKIEDAPSGGGGRSRKAPKSQGEKDAEKNARDVKSEIEDLQKQVREQEAITAATHGLTEGTLAYNLAKEKAIELAKNNVNANSAEGQQITTLVTKIETAKDATEALKKQREALSTAADSFKDGFADALDEIILKGANAQQVFRNLAQTLASSALKGLLTGGGPLGGIMGGGGGILGTLLGGIGAHADGGRISGPGTGRSDSILARLSDGEFVVNSRAAREHLPLLHAINSGGIPKFADGGLVSPVAMPTGSFGGGGRTGGDVHVTSNVTLNASGGTPEQNHDLARQASAHMEASIRKLVNSELQAQMRSGNTLNR